MGNVLKLIKAGYEFRKNAKKCYECPTDSQEYLLAKYYDDHFTALNDKDVSQAHLNSLVQELNKRLKDSKNSEAIQHLLESVLHFVEALKPLSKS